jgi:endonuclease/exonuclease/phosphatase family metal-dependent hydrolase
VRFRSTPTGNGILYLKPRVAPTAGLRSTIHWKPILRTPMSIARRSAGRPSAVRLVICFAVFCFAGNSSAPTLGLPRLLTYSELVTLYEQDPPAAALETKLDALLNTPFVGNVPAGSARRATVGFSGRKRKALYMSQWNIERGINFEAIQAALQGPDAFSKMLSSHPSKDLSAQLRKTVLDQASVLARSDVIILNEVDWGLKRSGYHNVAKELAGALGMNYAYGVEFVEVDPITLDIENLAADGEDDPAIAENLKLDKARTLGLHGNAILSRFPLKNVRIYRFKVQGHDWYHAEKNDVTRLEKLKRAAGDKLFLEKVFREVRRGGRMVLVADIEDSSFPGNTVTIVDAHLEARTKPKNRVLQEEEILEQIKGINHPVIFAGDMNTTGKDSTPTSIRDEIFKRLGSTSFWAKKAISWSTGIGLALDVPAGILGFYRTYADPTVRHVHILAENDEAKFFSTLEKFRFEDGNNFDFRGDKEHSYNGRGRKLANSNERNAKGFVETFELTRSYRVLKFKLDWFFVKPADAASEKAASWLFAPIHGQTLKELNYGLDERLSDHNPIAVELPLTGGDGSILRSDVPAHINW